MLSNTTHDNINIKESNINSNNYLSPNINKNNVKDDNLNKSKEILNNTFIEEININRNKNKNDIEIYSYDNKNNNTNIENNNDEFAELREYFRTNYNDHINEIYHINCHNNNNNNNNNYLKHYGKYI
ncbi:hypothetical protein U3516DRAFT_654943 [Neocallimastix sp. 'constans']